MNFVDRIDRRFLTQYRNEDDFLTDPTTDFVPFFKGEIVEKMKVISTYEVSTVVTASDLNQILLTTALAGGIYLTLPFTTWADEGLVAGNTIRILANGNIANETVTSIAGDKMLITDTGLLAALGIGVGDQADFVIRVTTQPTSLIFKFGILPNSVIPNSFDSLLDGQEQAYSSNAITGILSDLIYLSSNSSDLGGVQSNFDSVTDGYIFTFTAEHEFRIPQFLAIWLAEYQGGLIPSDFSGTSSWRYISELNFGVDVNNPNDGKVFTDPFELGAIGFLGQSFNAGVTNYELISTTLVFGGVTVDAPEISGTTTVTSQIKKLSGSFVGAQKGYVYHHRLSNEIQYSENSDTYDDNFIIDQIFNLVGVGAVSGTIIKNLTININADPTLLDVVFELEYSPAQQFKFNDGEWICLEIIVGDPTLSAIASDRMAVELFVAQITKNTDEAGLVTNFNPSFKNPGSNVVKTNGNLWVNRALNYDFTFELNKNIAAYSSVDIKSIAYKLVSYNVAEDVFFLMDSFNFPFGTPPSVLVGGLGSATYQILNVDTTRVLSVPERDELREVVLTLEAPAVYEPTQLVTGKIGFIIPHQEWKLNSNVPYEFYDGALPPNFNRNQRTSNYSDELGYDIYVFLDMNIESVKNVGGERSVATTNYILNSSKYNVADFNEDVAGDGWTRSYQIFNDSNVPVPFFPRGSQSKIEVYLESPTAGAISLQGFLGEIIIEETDNTGGHKRLHSSLDWQEESNPLKPISPLIGVKIEQDIPGNKITLSCLVDGTLLTEANQNIYGHIYR